MSFLFKFFPTIFDADFKWVRSGLKFFFTGVGTVIIKKLDFFSKKDLLVILDLLFKISSFAAYSLFLSTFLLRSLTLLISVSNPIVSNFFFNLTKSGSPT